MSPWCFQAPPVNLGIDETNLPGPVRGLIVKDHLVESTVAACTCRVTGIAGSRLTPIKLFNLEDSYSRSNSISCFCQIWGHEKEDVQRTPLPANPLELGSNYWVAATGCSQAWKGCGDRLLAERIVAGGGPFQVVISPAMFLNSLARDAYTESKVSPFLSESITRQERRRGWGMMEMEGHIHKPFLKGITQQPWAHSEEGDGD